MWKGEGGIGETEQRWKDVNGGETAIDGEWRRRTKDSRVEDG